MSRTARAAPTMEAVCNTAAFVVAADSGAQPPSTVPTTLSAGADTSSKCTAYNALPAMLGSGTDDRPSACASTSNTEMPSGPAPPPVRTAQRKKSDEGANPTRNYVPESKKPLPRRRAEHEIAPG